MKQNKSKIYEIKHVKEVKYFTCHEFLNVQPANV